MRAGHHKRPWRLFRDHDDRGGRGSVDVTSRVLCSRACNGKPRTEPLSGRCAQEALGTGVWV